MRRGVRVVHERRHRRAVRDDGGIDVDLRRAFAQERDGLLRRVQHLGEVVRAGIIRPRRLGFVLRGAQGGGERGREGVALAATAQAVAEAEARSGGFAGVGHLREGGIVREPRLRQIPLARAQFAHGGERALTGIALLFAFLRYRPSPFSVLDEIDAPLDEANVMRFGRFLQEFAEQTQFIVVTNSIYK